MSMSERCMEQMIKDIEQKTCDIIANAKPEPLPKNCREIEESFVIWSHDWRETKANRFDLLCIDASGWIVSRESVRRVDTIIKSFWSTILNSCVKEDDVYPDLALVRQAILAWKKFTHDVCDCVVFRKYLSCHYEPEGIRINEYSGVPDVASHVIDFISAEDLLEMKRMTGLKNSLI